MSIKSESIATQLFLAMDEAIEKKDRKAFMKAIKDERLHNCVVGNEQYEKYLLSLYKRALNRFIDSAEMEYIHRAFNVMNDRIANLEAENAKLEKLNSAAVERLAYHACPSVPSRNNYGQPCNDSDDCVACWREYLGGVEQMNKMAMRMEHKSGAPQRRK
jgi:hypothetical protein